MNYYDAMGKDITPEVLKWKQAYDAAQPQVTKVKVVAEKAVVEKKTVTKKVVKPTVAAIAPVIVEDVFNPVAVGSEADTQL